MMGLSYKIKPTSYVKSSACNISVQVNIYNTSIDPRIISLHILNNQSLPFTVHTVFFFSFMWMNVDAVVFPSDA